MIYLIDNQLPAALAGHLNTRGLDAIHVCDCGLERADDQEIWDYAKANGCVIVSKDEDFFHMSGKDPSGPPIVWVRLGNCRNQALIAAFDRVLSDLVDAFNAGAKVVELR